MMTQDQCEHFATSSTTARINNLW